MTLRSPKKLPTTAPMVRAGITRKSLLRRIVSRSASAALWTGVAFLVSPLAQGQQSGQQSQRFAPPIHIQPAAYSVLDEKRQPFPRSAPAQGTQRGPARTASQSQYISEMSQYMRNQNESVTAAKDAKVNAALRQLQASRAMMGQGNSQQQAMPSPAVPQKRMVPVRQQQAPPQYQQPSVPMQRTIHVNPPKNFATSPSRGRLPQQRGTNGLQDRISQAWKKTFARPERVQPNVAQRSDQRNSARSNQPVRDSNVRLVDHTVESQNEGELLPVLGDLPEVAPVPRQRAQQVPATKYRPRKRQAKAKNQVVVPSFVEAETDSRPLRLASTQDVIGSGIRTPRVTSQAKPMSYRPQRVARQDEISVFQNAASRQIPTQDDSFAQDQERLRQLDMELDADPPRDSDNELPQRSRPQEDTSLLGMGDQENDDEARRARSDIDSEIDSLEDEDPVDDETPTFDDRTCSELRSLLLDKSIRDISLDLSPQASSRRDEMGTITRTWTDVSGNVLATGTMVDLRRGYVILGSGQKLPYAKLSEADWSAIHENWLLPSVCSIGQKGSVHRSWVPQTVSWHASSLCHKPLYFENRQLERYGHSRGPYLQPIHSTLHFFGSILFLPYNTAINPPNECQYSLGFYRPGNCAPWLLDPVPFSREGLRRQALIATGIGFIP